MTELCIALLESNLYLGNICIEYQLFIRPHPEELVVWKKGKETVEMKSILVCVCLYACTSA